MKLKDFKPGRKSLKISDVDVDSIKGINVDPTDAAAYIDKQRSQRTAQDELLARIEATRDLVPKVAYPESKWIDMMRAWLTYKLGFSDREALSIIQAENEALSKRQSAIHKAKIASDDQAASVLLKQLRDKWERSKQFVQVWTEPRRQKIEGGVSFDRNKGILQWKCRYCNKIHTCDFFVNTSTPDNKLIADHVLLQKGCWQTWECNHDRKSNLPAYADLETCIWFDSEALKRHSQDPDAAVILSEIPPQELWTGKPKVRVRVFTADRR